MSRLVVFFKEASIRFPVVAFLILFLSFYANIFGVGQSQAWFDEYEEFSSLLVKKTAECKSNGYYSGPIVPVDAENYLNAMRSDGCGVEDFRPYHSQFGLQARAVALLAPEDDRALPYFLKWMEVIFAALSAAVLTAFLVRVRSLLGATVGYVVLGFVSVSVWIVAYGRNLYWAEFMIMLPFVFSFLTYEYFKRRRKLYVFYGVLALLFFLKLLNGFEHVSTLVVSGLVPIVFFELYRNSDARLLKLWKKAAAVFCAGFVALSVAILVSAVALTEHYGSLGESAGMVIGRAGDRAAGALQSTEPNVIHGFYATTPEVYKFIDKFYDLDVLKDGQGHPLKYAVTSAINYLSLPAISMPVVLREPFGSFVQSVGAMLTFVIVILHLPVKSIGGRSGHTTMRAFRYTFYTALLGSLSWLLLMPAHAYPHAHLNGIVFAVPTLLIGYIIIAIFMTSVMRRYVKK